MQVSLLKALQGFKNLKMNDLEAGREILASPSLLTGERWDAKKTSVDMPNCWSASELERHSGALAVVLAIIRSTLDDSQDKLVISSYRWDELQLIEKCMQLLRRQNEVVILSKSSNKKYQETFDAFNEPLNESPRILLMPSMACGVGFNMIGANRLLMMGADWDPTNDLQLSRRCWRPGQMKEVFVWRVVTQGCLDERVLERGLNKVELEKLVSSAGVAGNARAVTQASKQRDTISRLMYAPGENCAWQEIVPCH